METFLGQDRQYAALKKYMPGAQERTVFVADIGGTNSNFGLCVHTHNTIELLASWHLKSVHITDSTSAIAYAYAYLSSRYYIKPQNICIAAAGIIDHVHGRCTPTNLSFTIEIEALQQLLPECTISLINDFEAIAYGYPFVDPAALIIVQWGQQEEKGVQAILGAGTGLGKVMLGWCQDKKRYQAFPSEGGHADAAFMTDAEYQLASFIKKENKLTMPVSWEHVVSGRGIQLLYAFFCSQQKKPNGIAQHPDRIFASAQSDKEAMQTVEWFMRLYGRCAKDYALNTLCTGGFFIAGGIAACNLQLLLQSPFVAEFQLNGKQRAFLQKVPITLIADYNVSLFGAAAYHLLYR